MPRFNRTTVFAFAMLLATPSFACKCREQTASEKFASHEYIFIGRAKAVERLGTETTRLGKDFTFKTSKVLKGSLESKFVRLRTGNGDGDCGESFVLGKDYLVYARKAEELFVIGICDGSVALKPYGESELDQIKNPPPKKEQFSENGKQEYLSGVIAFQKGDYEKAKQHWDRCIAINPTADEAGNARAGLGRLQKIYPELFDAK